MPAEKARVLCVDDEPQVLKGLALHLSPHFDLTTAHDAAQGLALLEEHGPFTVIISDMQMPGMNGAAFLARAKEIAPDAIRMLLTGQADLAAAVAAVNQGQIFRFLTKPCPAPVILQAVRAGVEQFRLVESERVLLEQTLAGSIRMLTEVLSLANPLAFGRAVRLKRLASQLCDRLDLDVRWHIEAAAQVSQVGCITLHSEVAEKLYYGQSLTPAEQTQVDRIPLVADQLLGNIPRLEPIREILAMQTRRFDGADTPWLKTKGEDLPIGARMLRLLVDYDRLEAAGTSASDALKELAQRTGCYDPQLLEELRGMLDDRAEELRRLALGALRPGMVFAEDVRSRTGALLIARGQTVTDGIIERMRNFSGQVAEPFTMLVQARS